MRKVNDRVDFLRKRKRMVKRKGRNGEEEREEW